MDNGTVVLVDDEAENLAALARFVARRHSDWTLHTFTSLGALQVALDAGLEFDVVVTDLVMQGEPQGIEVLQEVKRRQPLAMVVMMTAYEQKLDRYSAFELGAYDCVAKNSPGLVAAEEIAVKVAAALNYRREVLSRLDLERRVATTARHLDPRVFKML